MEVNTTLRLSTSHITPTHHLHPLPFLQTHVETSNIRATLSLARFAQEVPPSFLSLALTMQTQHPPALVEETGPGWVFLYRKRLEVSDVRVDQNRLFVRAVGTERILEGFMRAEERAAVVDQKGPGIEFEGVDGNGRKYNLRMKKWGSLGVTAVKTEWSKMVKANQAKAGHWVDVWGRRLEEGGFSLAFIFSDGEEDGGGGKKAA